MVQADPRAQALAAEYLAALAGKQAVDARFQAAKQSLLDYSVKSKRKFFPFPTGRLTVSVKQRTVFPKYNQPGRRELEAAVKTSDWWDKSLSFDVIKLAEAYDAGRLPHLLAGRLTKLAKSEPQVRIFVHETGQKKD